MINISVLSKYAALKRQMAELDAQLSELKPAVLETLATSGPVAAEDYEIRLKSRKTWSYPKTVATAEKKLKALRLKAQIEETATFTESQYIECKLADG